ncbi:MAG TPA: ABC transporter permease [Solirubrobacterales bacterium]|nr:ABC transporter permease [Solirubrobacterales bacterium]
MSSAGGAPAIGADLPELREIPGPSAFGTDRTRFWELLWIVSVSDFKQTYANTTLGFLWTIIKPLVFFGVIFVVLRGILRFGADVPNYPLILVMGLIMFQYFQEVTTRGVRSIPNRESMIRKMHFPRIIVPLSIALTATLTLFFNLLAVSPLFFAFGLWPTLEWLWMIPILATLILFSTALGLILSVTFIRFPDVDQVWSLVARVLFYASPVLFPIEKIPEPFDVVMTAVNPLAPLIELARVVVIDPNAPGPLAVAGPLLGVLLPLSMIAFAAVFSLWIFKREAPRVAEAL